MTETGPLGLLLSGEMALAKVGSSGLPPLYVRLKICDPDGNEVSAGETGELMIKGPTVTPGYWNRPEANRTSFTEDGWFHTGDAARQDDGRLLLHRRPLEGHVHLRRRERLSGRGRERDLPARRRAGERRGRRPAREMGRDRPRLCRAEARRQPRRGGRDRALRHASSPATRCRRRCASSASCRTMRPARC